MNDYSKSPAEDVFYPGVEVSKEQAAWFTQDQASRSPLLDRPLSKPDEEITQKTNSRSMSSKNNEDLKRTYNYFQALFMKMLREGSGDDQGEGKFGIVPLSVDPNTLLKQKVKSSYDKQSAGLRAHPLLSRSQQFSGIDRKLTAVPADNPTANNLYLEYRLRCQLQQKKRQAPTLKR
jgi:hypothetical protein